MDSLAWSLREMGQQAQANENWSGAAAWLTEALQVPDVAYSADQRLALTLAIAHSHLKSESQDAESWYAALTPLMEHGDVTVDDASRAAVLYGLAKSQMVRRSYDAALDTFGRCLLLQEQLGNDPVSQSDVLTLMGQAAHQSGRDTEAADYIRRSVMLLEGKDLSYSMGNTFFQAAAFFQDLQLNDAAATLYETAAGVAEAVGAVKLQRRAHAALASLETRKE